jgi:hypothetical protein
VVQAVCISTAAGAGMKSTNKDMADSAFFWGCARIYKLGFAVRATDWDSVSPKNRAAVEKKAASIAKAIQKRCGSVKPSLKTKAFFHIMRMLQKDGWNEADKVYWNEKGWTSGKKPWKQR